MHKSLLQWKHTNWCWPNRQPVLWKYYNSVRDQGERLTTGLMRQQNQYRFRNDLARPQTSS